MARFSTRVRAASMLIMLGLVCAIVAVLMAFWFAASNSPVAASASDPANSARIEPLNLARMRETARLGDGAVLDITFLPDRSDIVAGSALGLTRYEMGTGRRLWVTETRWPVERIRASPDGGMLATLEIDPRTLSFALRLWKSADGSLLRTLEEGHQAVGRGTFAFSPDGQTLATWLGAKSTLTFRRVADGTLITDQPPPGTSQRQWVAFVPPGNLVVVAGGSSPSDAATLRRASDGRSAGVLRKSQGASDVRALAISPTGDILAAVDVDGVMIWRVQQTQPIYQATVKQPLSGSASTLAFAPDGATLAIAGITDGEAVVQVLRASNAEMLTTWHWSVGSAGELGALAYSPDGLTLATTTSGVHPVQVWRVQDGKLLQTIGDPAITRVTFSPDGQHVFAGAADGTVKSWPLNQDAPVRTFASSDRRAVQGLSVSADGETLLTAHGSSRLSLTPPSGTLRLWRIWDDSLLRAFDNRDPVRGGTFSPDGQYALTLEEVEGRTLAKLRRGDDGAVVRTFGQDQSSLVDAVFSPGGEFLATTRVGLTPGTGRGVEVWLWRVSDGAILRTFRGNGTENIDALAFSPDGLTLATSERGPGGSWIRLWRVADGTELSLLRHGDHWASSLVFSPDGGVLASGDGIAGDIILWRVGGDTASWGATLSQHRRMIGSVAFSPDGTLLASASADGTVRLWSIR
jgi:WD40 repeat protein